jgi:hypothetical protein
MPAQSCSQCWAEWDAETRRLHINVMCRLLYREVALCMAEVRRERRHKNREAALSQITEGAE